MTKAEVMKELKANGTAQNCKVYRRHGVQGEMFGVSYAALGKLKRKIKTNQALAEELWATGIHDARILATMIADGNKIGVRTLDAWVKDIDSRVLAAALSNVAAVAKSAKTRMEKWTTSKNELIACTGWNTLASIARQDNALADKYFEEFLAKIESNIHGTKNWAKDAMNNALISIGTRNAKLEKKAIAAAKRIGKVEIDHGETGCKTPDAASYIKKTVAYNKKKASKARRQR